MRTLLRVFWNQLFGRDERARGVQRWHTSIAPGTATSTSFFLIMRRMRAPLITLIVIFAISVVGFTFVPGQDASGAPARMDVFDAFYFMSYTATTIGFGELPNAFTAAQRMWAMVTIYLTVVGWAYAIGSLLTLLQDRAFRQALATRRVVRQVARMREPFLLLAGYGRTGELLGRAFDALGQQLVVIDKDPDRIDALNLAAFRATAPGLAADARNPHHLGLTGLDHPYCTGVLALTDDDEANLAIAMTAALLRPELTVITRTLSRVTAARMHEFGTPTVVNPFDRFGDHLRLALRSPAAYQLLSWLEAGPGAPLPDRADPPQHGRWVMCGYGRFGRELTADLRAEGLEVTVIDSTRPVPTTGEGPEESELDDVDVETAVGLVAGTSNDIANLSLLASARERNPRLFLAARQNRPENAPLYTALGVDSLLVPTEVIAHEVYAQLSTPLLWRFLHEMPARGNDDAVALIARLRDDCGPDLPPLWRTDLSPAVAPALADWIAAGGATLGALLRSPEDRAQPLKVVALMVLRDGTATVTPGPDFVLAAGDQLLMAGRPAARRVMEALLFDDSLVAYLLTGRHVPSGWIGRRLLQRS
ncbi:potassium channel family protein [Nakamurella deserti]|uniref:potassium channel family protein n=1 Tax=Nakamurella deserti TaxID=2164074 RepID=UPI000DBE6F9F|nr:NAD-binding protein [Nakamurella deserti]